MDTGSPRGLAGLETLRTLFPGITLAYGVQFPYKFFGDGGAGSGLGPLA